MKRIQRQRTAGWRMPENAKYVGRPTKWGNRFKPCLHLSERAALGKYKILTRARVVLGLLDLNELRGKDLACWCPLDRPCHVDVLLDLLRDSECPECSGAEEHHVSCPWRMYGHGPTK